MSLRRRAMRAADRRAQGGKEKVIAPAVSLAGSGKKWGVTIAPGIWLSAPALDTRPSWWFRCWQRLLLGWTWEQR